LGLVLKTSIGLDDKKIFHDRLAPHNRVTSIKVQSLSVFDLRNTSLSIFTNK